MDFLKKKKLADTTILKNCTIKIKKESLKTKL